MKKIFNSAAELAEMKLQGKIVGKMSKLGLVKTDSRGRILIDVVNNPAHSKAYEEVALKYFLEELEELAKLRDMN